MKSDDTLWWVASKQENLITRWREKKKELHIKTWDQKLGLRDNALAMAGLVFIIAFLALIITT